MPKRQKDSARLEWIHGFLASAAYRNYTQAGKELGISATKVSRNLEDLEKWLRRPLLFTETHTDSSEPFEMTIYGEDFAQDAMRIVNLIDEGGLKNEIKRTRIQPDGAVLVDGCPLNTSAAFEIGKILIKHRAKIEPDQIVYKKPTFDFEIFRMIVAEMLRRQKI